MSWSACRPSGGCHRFDAAKTWDQIGVRRIGSRGWFWIDQMSILVGHLNFQFRSNACFATFLNLLWVFWAWKCCRVGESSHSSSVWYPARSMPAGDAQCVTISAKKCSQKATCSSDFCLRSRRHHAFKLWVFLPAPELVKIRTRVWWR